MKELELNEQELKNAREFCRENFGGWEYAVYDQDQEFCLVDALVKFARTYYEGSDIHAEGKAAVDSFCEILRGFKEAGVSAELNAKGSIHRSHLQGHWEGISAAYYAAYLKLNDWLAVKYGKNYTKSPDRSPDNNTPQASEDKGLADEGTAGLDLKTLKRVKGGFELFSDYSCACLGYGWLCRIIDIEENGYSEKSPTPPQEKDKPALPESHFVPEKVVGLVWHFLCSKTPGMKRPKTWDDLEAILANTSQMIETLEKVIDSERAQEKDKQAPVGELSDNETLPDLSSLGKLEKGEALEKFSRETAKHCLAMYMAFGFEWGFESELYNEPTKELFHFSFRKLGTLAEPPPHFVDDLLSQLSTLAQELSEVKAENEKLKNIFNQ